MSTEVRCSRVQIEIPVEWEERIDPMIQLTNVKKTYENGTDAVCGINLQIDDGEFVFVAIKATGIHDASTDR